ncbi:MAG: phytanoyl-CoA dioxygenase family protein [Bacteroidota bacterium]
MSKSHHTLSSSGYQVLPSLLSDGTVNKVLRLIQANPHNNGFGIRDFLPNNPLVHQLLKQESTLQEVLRTYFDRPICVRSIYFDKPPRANWVVGWHQDLTMNLRSVPSGGGWQNIRRLKDRVVAQAPTDLLTKMVTLRLHLDDTDEGNGALRVVPKVHQQGIIRTDTREMEQANERAVLCQVPSGGALLMKPLTPHASRRTREGTRPRRVIHLEFLDRSLLNGIDLHEASMF